MRHNNPTQSSARRNTKVQIRRRIQIPIHNRRQFPFRIIIDIQYQRPALRIDRRGRLARLQQLDNTLNGQNDATLRHIDDHANGRQRCDQILWMRRSNRNGNGAQIQTTVERTDEIETGRENEGDMIAGIDFAAFLQESGDLFGALVQLGAGERFGDSSYTDDCGFG